MASYVQLGEVRTWYDEHGSGEPLVLLHPGAVDTRAFEPNIGALADRFHVFTPERRGHGRTADVEGPISYELMAQDTIAFLETVVGGPAYLVGCSDGATVALLVARRRPDLALRVVIVSGVFHHQGWLPGVLDWNEEAAAFLGTSYGEVSPDGAEHYPVVLAKLDRMHASEPTLTASELAGATSRAMVMTGDDDEVAFEHTIELYSRLPDAELAIVPGTSHGLLVEKPDLCNRIILDFLTTEPVPTYAPISRASP